MEDPRSTNCFICACAGETDTNTKSTSTNNGSLECKGKGQWHEQRQQEEQEFFNIIWKLLDLNCSTYYDWWRNEYNNWSHALICCTCETKVKQVQGTMRELHLLQVKLNTLRDEIKKEIICAYELRTLALSLDSTMGIDPPDVLRNKIVADLRATANDQNRQNEPPTLTPRLVNIKEEIPISPPMPVFHYFDEREDIFDFDHQFSTSSPPPSPSNMSSNNNLANLETTSRPAAKLTLANIVKSENLSFTVSSSSASRAKRPKTRSTKCKKEIKISLQRIDEVFPTLQTNLTIQRILDDNDVQFLIPVDSVNDLQQVVDEEEEEVPSDTFNASTYQMPSRCKIDGCVSQTLFKAKFVLARHIKEQHLEKVHKEPDPWDAYAYPTLCPRENCSSETLFQDKHRLKRHIRDIHDNSITPEMLESIDLSGYESFPSKCQEPGCTSLANFQKTNLRRHILYVHRKPIVADRPKEPWDYVTLPTKCPMPDCKQEKLFDERWRLKKHLRFCHLQKLQDPLDKYDYPSFCQIEGCKSKVEYPDKWKLRRHMKSSHNIYAKDFQKLNCTPPEHRLPSTPPQIYESASGRFDAAASTTRPSNSSASTSSSCVICEICGLSLSAPALKTHLRLHTGEVLTCDICGSNFRSNGGLVEHKEARHSDAAHVFRCTMCPKTFKLRPRLKIHLRRHKGIKTKICSICSMGFMFKIELEEHKRYVHWEVLGLQPHQCQLCNKIYSRRENLAKHMKSHSGTNKYHCSLCKYHTDRSKDFSEHMETVHCSEFPHKCEVCGKGFKLRRRLVEHTNYHVNNYTFTCPICGRRCSDGRKLKLHLRRQHTKEDLRKQNLMEIDEIQGQGQDSSQDNND